MNRKQFFLWIGLLGVGAAAGAQELHNRLATAVTKLQQDTQLRHAILGISVVKSETGERVFESNAQTGLAPASCQKIITSAAAWELLGPSYRYATRLGYTGSVSDGVLNGNLVVMGSGDPSMGSWRYDSTRNDQQLMQWIGMMKAKGITRINGSLIGYNRWENQSIPGGWIWDDMGNYYGAGTSSLNWHENQYDLFLRSGSVLGSKVSVVETKPRLYEVNLQSEVTAAAKGSGDNAYIYLSPFSATGFVRGTIPVDEKAFTISGSFPDPGMQFLYTFEGKLDAAGMKPLGFSVANRDAPLSETIGTLYSPGLDSLNYWFMKKSINFYGETFVKTIAAEKTGIGSAEKGLAVIRDFWKEKGIDPAALHMLDGSGLSPQNRVTTDALVSVLQYARTRPWFRYYYDALPVYNQMKLKSGTIGGAKSFAGYHTAKDGTTYTVAIIVNNFDGQAGEVVKKMFAVLDELK